jgi:uncharacterized protein YbbC (DUF1343 family)
VTKFQRLEKLPPVGTRFQLGLEVLLGARRALLRGRRVGLLAHPASLDTRGVHAAVRLREVLGRGLVALYGPEHGFHGRGGAGEELGHDRHPAWGIPIFSLYGEHRKPTPAMLDGVDALVCDLQDIAVRCYTFVTSLRYVMEACAEQGRTLIVCDRPVPLPNVVDGPLPTPAFSSFVAGVPVPLVYGMTPGETALFLQRRLNLKLDLHVCAVKGYRREAVRGNWGPWVSPSPGIRYWETAWTYPITVITEALTALDCGRGGTEPFQLVAAPWIAPERLARELNRRRLPGLRAVPLWGRQPGVRLQVDRPDALRPFAAAVHLVHALHRLYGAERVWSGPGTRPEWFDRLMGTDAVRDALLGGATPRRILEDQAAERQAFSRQRSAVLLYRRA